MSVPFDNAIMAAGSSRQPIVKSSSHDGYLRNAKVTDRIHIGHAGTHGMVDGMKWHAPVGIILLVAVLASAFFFSGGNRDRGVTTRPVQPPVVAKQDDPAQPRAPATNPVAPAQPASPPYVSIDGSGGTVIAPRRKVDTASAADVYVENGLRYEIYDDIKGKEWHRPIWQSPSIYPYNGAAPSLAFEACRAHVVDNTCPPTADNNFPNDKDREELAVISHATGTEQHQLRFGRTRYLSFLVYFHEVSEVPSLWTLISQVWQVDGNGPPFAIWIKPAKSFAPGQTAQTAPLELRFAARDDTTTDGFTSICEDGDTSVGCPAIIYSKQVMRGRWYHFAFRFQPSHSGDGQIAIWDGGSAIQTRPAVVWSHDWGYATGSRQGSAKDKFDVRVGIYRRQQPRALLVMFDDIRYGPTAASVEPR